MFRTLLCALLLCPGAALAAGSPALSAPAGPTITVQPKDTAYSLARKYNLSVGALLALNHLAGPDLQVGQVLLVSPPTYTVARGDTAFSVARRSNMSVDALLALNNLTGPALRVGQVLTLAAPTSSAIREAVSPGAVKASITLTPAPSPTPAPAPAPLPPLSYVSASLKIVPQGMTTLERPGDSLIISLPDSPLTAAPSPTSPSLAADLPVTPEASSDQGEGALSTSTTDWLVNAQSFLGVPYVYGGKSRSGTDCSGLVVQVFAPLGLSLPRVSADQAQIGMPVERSALQGGDLVFFDTEGRGRVTHVGIVVEGQTFISANSFAGRVAMDDLGSRYWASRYLGARRVLGVMALGAH